MSKYDESDGVWRTVGGRRIFIREGQSLSSAMKSSGKFKSSQQKYKEESEEKVQKGKKELAKSYSDKELKDEIKDYQHELKELEADYYGVPSEHRTEEMTKRFNKQYEATEKRLNELKAEQKSRNPEDKEQEEKLYKDFEEHGAVGQSYSEYKAQMRAEKQKSNNFSKMSDQELKDKLSGKDSSVKTQQSDIEKASGLKVKRAFETDNFGNGKEDRFQLEDGRYVAHTKESLGAKDDTWSIEKVENGSIKSQDFKSYDDMIKHLSGNKNNTSNYIDKIQSDDGNTVRFTLKKNFGPSQSNTAQRNAQSLKNELEEQYGRKIKSWNFADKNSAYVTFENKNESKSTSNNEKITKSPEMKTADVMVRGSERSIEFEKDGLARAKRDGQSVSNISDRTRRLHELELEHQNDIAYRNRVYKNAFEEYKKKHPNTKLNLQKFIDMSEGK